jgi:cell division transport system permease protein
VSTVDQLKQRVDFSIYLKTDVTDQEVTAMRSKLTHLDNVNNVRYIDSTTAKKSYIEQNHPSTEQLQAISELPANLNPFLPSLRVVIKDPNDTSALSNLVSNDSDFKNGLNPDPRRKPSFAGERKGVIETIGRWAQLAERGGIGASLVFIAISMLIIFNTIRMAIFNRRDEIEMMKLIGAERNFIRGPFVVEAVMYGFFAALAATILGYLMLVSAEPKLAGYGIAVAGTKETMMVFAPLVLVGMIILGAIIGSLSARLAVRRYLRV